MRRTDPAPVTRTVFPSTFIFVSEQERHPTVRRLQKGRSTHRTVWDTYSLTVSLDS